MKSRLFEKTCRVLITALLFTGGCGPVEEEASPPPLTYGVQAELSDNGLSFNGLSFNGLSFNGLSFNGLSFNGLSTSNFNTWFQADPALASGVMRYLVRCAVPAGQTRTYTSSTGHHYAWAGELGLAPAWASGAAPTLYEQQVVSACLAAHANRLATEVSISVLGRDAGGAAIPYTSAELASHSRRESCFFGNVFTGQGLYVGTEREPLGPNESTSRACGALLHGGTEAATPCAPLVHVGDCTAFCTLDSSGHFFSSCTYNGTTYHRPLTTRLRVEDIHKCGDTHCQATERCGTSYRYDSCGLDCGSCP
ncbi:hypothetical protein [Pyxidicoccus trucidator]|uniref:hypothetical protein n=1 Tax=Pyxidicoccus trucidator TaxID=2709662 RepID=UPI0013DC4E5B|nr:hypothetical protein [Pyxidicoccus trucidator]